MRKNTLKNLHIPQKVRNFAYELKPTNQTNPDMKTIDDQLRQLFPAIADAVVNNAHTVGEDSYTTRHEGVIYDWRRNSARLETDHWEICVSYDVAYCPLVCHPIGEFVIMDAIYCDDEGNTFYPSQAVLDEFGYYVTPYMNELS